MVLSGPWVTVFALRHRCVVALPAQIRWQTGVLVTSMGLLGWSQTVPPRPSVPSQTRQSCHRGPPFSPFASVPGKWVRDVPRRPYCWRSREPPCAPPAPALHSCPPACPRLPLGFQSTLVTGGSSPAPGWRAAPPPSASWCLAPVRPSRSGTHRPVRSPEPGLPRTLSPSAAGAHLG